MSDPIPMEKWGKDHWSMLAYIESRCVDYKGVLDRDHVRCDPDVHPGLTNRGNAMSPSMRYPTRLRGGVQVTQHDDWSCAEDMEKAGLLKWEGTGIHPVFVLTDLGKRVAAQLRQHKMNGGKFADFNPVLGC